MTSKFLALFCGLILFFLGQVALQSAEEPVKEPESPPSDTTQTLLGKYRQAIEDTCLKNAKPTDAKLRDLLLTPLKSNFKKEVGSATVPEKKIAQHFDAFMDNIATARSGFKFKDGDKYRDQFIAEAALVFVIEVKGATDLTADRTPNGWFETFSGMLQQLRDKLSSRPGLGARVAGVLAPLFMEVYKSSNMNLKSDIGSDYKAQTALVRRLFPISNEDLKEKNASIAKLLETQASSILKARTK